MLGGLRQGRLRRVALLGLVFHVLFLAAAPLEHHDLVCHLKTPQHCTSCGSSPPGAQSHEPASPGACRLADAGRAIALDIHHDSALLAVGTTGRSPPLA